MRDRPCIHPSVRRQLCRIPNYIGLGQIPTGSQSAKDLVGLQGGIPATAARMSRRTSLHHRNVLAGMGSNARCPLDRSPFGCRARWMWLRFGIRCLVQLSGRLLQDLFSQCAWSDKHIPEQLWCGPSICCKAHVRDTRCSVGVQSPRILELGHVSGPVRIHTIWRATESEQPCVQRVG